MSDEPSEKVLIVPDPPPSLIPPPEAPLPRRGLSSRPPPSASSLRGIVAPPSSRSLPPLPAIEPILDEAEAARNRGDFDAALDAYKKALLTVDATDTAAHASLYASIAEVKLAQGKKREAETNFEKALGVSPKHLRSLDGLVILAMDAKEWPRVVAFRQKRAAAMDDEDERIGELVRVAQIQEKELGDAKKGRAFSKRLPFLIGSPRSQKSANRSRSNLRSGRKPLKVAFSH